MYVNQTTDVIITCPIHGDFTQRPNNHYMGAGCPECHHNKRCDTNTFIKKARAIHGNKYDYSKVNYTNNKTKVLIICPIHGKFEQTPDKHLRGQGCPGCSSSKLEQTNLQRYGARRPLQNQSIRDRVMKTNLDKYGVDNPMKSKDIQDRLVATNMDKYGVPYSCMADLVIKKKNQTLLEQYGGLSPFASKEVQHKASKSIMDRYGVKNVAMSDDVQKKIRMTCQERYGTYTPLLSPSIREKCYATMRIKGTFNTSEPEDIMYQVLCNVFDKNDVFRQYKSDEYPYACDFYIKSRNMYVELNASWTHGHHWFNSEYKCDFDTLDLWMSKHTVYYDNAVTVWSIRDVEKRHVAEQNCLNYVTFWMNNLLDFYVWLSLDCPDGHDYDKMYSWLPKRCELRLNKPHYKKLSNGNISQLAKYYQQDVFYAREKTMWHDNLYFKDMPLQMYLYANRQKYLSKSPLEISDAEILRGFGISGILRSYTVFDVSVMQDVIKTYNIKSVIDPCAGWGERMLCCYANDVKYQGFDINMLLCEGYDNMIDDFEMCDQTISFGDSSIANISGHYDAVITCPPYYNTEIYSKTGAENLSYDDFLSWWNKVVQNFSNVTYFCFQINQKYKNDMSNIVLQNGFQLIDIISQNTKTSHFNRKNGVVSKHEYEEMLIFKK